MTSRRRSSAPTLAAISANPENRELNDLWKGLKSARGKGLNFEHLLHTPSAACDPFPQSGVNSVASHSTGRAADPGQGLSHTPNHVNCPACESFDELVKADLLGMASQTFEDAAIVWQRIRRNSNVLRQRTHEAVDEYIVALTKFFNGILMRSINPGMLRAYQVARSSNALTISGQMHHPWRRKASNSRINQELNVHAQMLRACKEWEKTRPYYFPFPVAKWSPRQILSEQEEEDLFRKVAGYPEAELAYCVAAITDNTTASGVELRCLKLENLYLRPAGEISRFTSRRRPVRTTTVPARSPSTMSHSGPPARYTGEHFGSAQQAPNTTSFPSERARSLRSDKNSDSMVSALFLESPA